MVATSDARKKSRADTELGWGGSRQKKWQTQGKRAVVHVEPGAYEFVVQLSRLCRRNNMEMCSHIFAAGLESLTGFSIKEISENDFQITARAADRPQPGTGALTHDQVRAVAALFSIIQEDGQE